MSSSPKESCSAGSIHFRNPWGSYASEESGLDQLNSVYRDSDDSISPRTPYMNSRGEHMIQNQPKKPCAFKENVVDNCYKSRFYASAMEHYLLNQDGQNIGYVHCPMVNCPGVFNDATDMLRHLKHCDSFARGVYLCPLCNGIETFKTTSDKRCSWKRIGSMGKAVQKLIRRLSRSKASRCPRCDYCFVEESQDDLPRYQERSLSAVEIRSPVVIRPPVEIGGVPSSTNTFGMTTEFPSDLSEVHGDINFMGEPQDNHRSMTYVQHHELPDTNTRSELCGESVQLFIPDTRSHSAIESQGSTGDCSAFSSFKSSPVELSSASTSQMTDYSTDVSPTSSAGAAYTHQNHSRLSFQQYAGVNSIPGVSGQSPNCHMTVDIQQRPRSARLQSTETNFVSTLGNASFSGPDLFGNRNTKSMLMPLNTKVSTLEPQSHTWASNASAYHRTDSSLPSTSLDMPSIIGLSPATLLDDLLPPSFNPSPLSQSPISFTSLEPSATEQQTDNLQCTKCTFVPQGKEGNRQSYLRKHIKTHNGQRIECPHAQCDKVFTRRDNATSHVKRTHPELIQPGRRRSKAGTAMSRLRLSKS